MFRFVAMMMLLASACAFAPSTRVASSSMKMAFAGGYPGADGPELKNFDPLKFAEKSPEWLPWFREAELKHGRVAMLATVGFIVADTVFQLPGDIHQVSSAAAHDVFVKSGAMIQILLWCGILEIITIPALQNMDKSGRAPGDYSFDPLGFGKKDLTKLKVNELKNGRLAMLAISGLLTQSGNFAHTILLQTHTHTR